jgi:hypothetical protein
VAQFTDGSIRAANGMTVVKAIWHLYLVSLTGTQTFSAGDPVSWNAGADNGDVTSWDAGNKILGIVRDVGDTAPAVGDIILSAAAGGTVDSLAQYSPPNFDTNVSVGDYLTIPGYATAIQITGSIVADSFAIAAAYTGSTLEETSYGVAVDFSTNRGYPVPGAGDLAALPMIGRAVTEVDADMKVGVFGDQQVVASGGTTNINWTLGHRVGLTLNASTTLTFTAPDTTGVWLVLRIYSSGAYTVAYPGSVLWSSDSGQGGDGAHSGSTQTDLVLLYYTLGSTYLALHWGNFS